MNWAGLNWTTADFWRWPKQRSTPLVTTDKNLRHQQNLAARRLAILVLPTTNWAELHKHEAGIAAAINSLKPGDFIEFRI
jgi:hypothetical protein